MSEPVVQISKLHVKYQHKPVFQDLNWTISRGDNWLLRGASGSGKTSLAKAIAGLIDFDGSIDMLPIGTSSKIWKDSQISIISSVTTNRQKKLQPQ
jgi:ABC-type molybdenum transport system ATPase subunit/photorepair protein PhrA